MHKAKNFNSKETTFREVRENPPAKQENKKRVILKNTKKKSKDRFKVQRLNDSLLSKIKTSFSSLVIDYIPW